MKEFFEIFNWRFLWFCFIAFFPLWFGIIGGTYLLIVERIEKSRKENDYDK